MAWRLNVHPPLAPELTQVNSTYSLCRRLENGLPPNPVAAAMRAGVADWQSALPAVAALRNTDLRERHWAAVGELLGTSMEKREEMALFEIMALGVSCSVVDARATWVQSWNTGRAPAHSCWGSGKLSCSCLPL